MFPHPESDVDSACDGPASELQALRDENRLLRERLRALESDPVVALAGSDLIADVARGVTATTGESFFRTLLGNLARALRAGSCWAFRGQRLRVRRLPPQFPQ